jgi:hypothetical protein
MNKKHIIVFALIGLVTLSSIFVVGAAQSAPQTGPISTDKAFSWGQEMSKVNTDQTAGTVVATVSNIKIFKSEVNSVVENNKAAGITKSYDDALKVVVRKDALYAESLKNGFTLSDSELQKTLDNAKAMTKNASNYDVFLQYLKGEGITEQQYWDGQKDFYLKAYTTQKWLDSVRSSDAKYKDDATWNTYYTQLSNDIVNKATVSYSSSNNN